MSESKSPLISDEQAAQIARGDSTFVNVEEAKEFINRVSDPATQEVLWLAYGIMGFAMSGVEVSAPFDALYFMKVLEKVLEQRDDLLRILSSSTQK